MFGDLKQKLNQGKEDLAKRMTDAYVRAHSSGKDIEIIANGNKEIVDIKLSPEILLDKEQLEDELITTLNKALHQADELFNSELKTVMAENMPNIPGLDGLLD